MNDTSQPSLPDTLEGVIAEINTTQAALVERLQDELVCAVCGSVFIDPRVLRCQHCFCLRCLYFTVSRDRTEQLEVTCAYRCEETTVTKGDIRTLPKNHYVTNTCILLRQHLVRRGQLLAKKLSLLSRSGTLDPAIPKECICSSTSSGTAFGDQDLSTKSSPHEALVQTTANSYPANQLLLKSERDLVAEMHECEWCSCSSPSCKVCPYCWSRVCGECRGQFSDHHYLCVEPSQPGCRPSEGWLPGSGISTAGVGAVSLTTSNGRRGEALVTRQSVVEIETMEGEGEGVEEEQSVFGSEDNAAFPFFITPSFVPTLVKECLVKQHTTPLQLSELDVTSVTPVRLAVPELAVKCQHSATGFTFEYAVHSAFATEDGVPVDNDTPHWSSGEGGKPSATLAFLANATRLGEVVLRDLHRLSTATSDVVLELSSAAHQAYVRRNKGFHMYALHLWVLVRAQCQIARDALLPHLERARLVENLMGDLVTYRFQQTMQRASPPQKHKLRERLLAFLNTEILLCRQLDQVTEGIDAACCGISALLGRMRDAMKELAQPKVHRGEEHKKSRQSRLRFSVQLFHNREGDAASASFEADDSAQMRAKATRSGVFRRSPSHANTTASPLSAAVDPALGDTAVPESSFRDQVCKHQGTTQVLTDSMISILRCFMQARVWEWSLSNTCVRECVMGDEDKRFLLQAEESLQLLTDDLVRGIWSCSRLVYILEVQQDEAGPASSLDILMDEETMALLDMGLENPTYGHSEVFEGLKSLSQIRNKLLSTSVANALAVHNLETQQRQLLTVVTSALTTTLQHQITVLRSVMTAEEKYERRFAAYLRTRQMTPSTGEAPPISEETLLAVDILKTLQRREQHHLEVLPAGASAAVATSLFGESSSGVGHDSHGEALRQRLTHARSYCPYPASQGQRDAQASSATLTQVRAYESRSVPNVLLSDFSRRDTALLSCQRYGEALVRAAKGQSLGDVRSVFDAQHQSSNDGSGAAEADASARVPTGLHRLPPLPTAVAAAATREVDEPDFISSAVPPPPALPADDGTAEANDDKTRRGSDSSDAALSEQAVTARTEWEDSANREAQLAGASANTPLSPGSTSASPTNMQNTSTAIAAPSSSSSKCAVEAFASTRLTDAAVTAASAVVAVANASGVSNEEEVAAATAPVPNLTHDELLFEADCSDTAVEMAPVIATHADESCQRKASRLFGETFNLSVITASVLRRHVISLPFYHGECTYKGKSTTFYVDAQTGVVYVNPQPFSGSLGRQHMLELLSSPVFFVVLNSVLIVLLHKRHQCGVFFK